MRTPLLVSVVVAAVVLAAGVAWGHLPVMVADPVASAKPGETVFLSHAYGHPDPAEWLACARPEQVLVHEPDGKTLDVTDTLEAFDAPERRKWRAQFTPLQAGDHVAELRCSSRVGGTRFEDVVKVVVHVGGPPKGWERAIGAPLEFVPRTRPYAIRKGSSVRLRLLWQGRPLSDALIGLEHMNDAPPEPKAPSELHTVRQERTDAEGEVTLTLPLDGWWVVFANVNGEQVEEDGRTLQVRHRGSFWIRVGW